MSDELVVMETKEDIEDLKVKLAETTEAYKRLFLAAFLDKDSKAFIGAYEEARTYFRKPKK